MNKFMANLLTLIYGLVLLLLIVDIVVLVYALYNITLWLVALTLFIGIALRHGLSDLKDLFLDLDFEE